MTYAERRPTGFAFGANCEPPAALVGGFVFGSLDAPRQVVRAEPLYRAYAELDDLPETLDPTREAYETVFRFPEAEFTEHIRRAGSPKGYSGPAACVRVPFDIDRAGNLDAALDDARKLARFLIGRYPTLERSLTVAFSGGKGFHLCLPSVPGFDPLPHTPATAKRFALAVANAAGVAIDQSIYHHQALFRLPNSRHGKSGLFKRFLDPDDLDRLTVPALLDAAKHPAGFMVRVPEDGSEQLAHDWEEAERAALSAAPLSSDGRRIAPSRAPVVPKYVRDFIGFGDIQDPGRAVTLFRCSAALAEAGTPAAVVFGLLEEVAIKTGLAPAEVQKQIRDGIAHGARKNREGVTV